MNGYNQPRRLSLDGSAGQWIADIAAKAEYDIQNDNGEALRRVKRNLPLAYNEALTPRQQQMIDLYYGEGLNMPQIAKELGVNRSTVSRTLQRARERLYVALRFSL